MDVALIRKSRWVMPAFVQPLVLFAFVMTRWALEGEPAGAKRTGWLLMGAAAVLTVAPGYRAQYRTHQAGFNSGPRLQRSGRSGFIWLMVAVGLGYEFLPPLAAATLVGAAAGFMQGAVIGHWAVCTRLLTSGPEPAPDRATLGPAGR